MATGKVTKRTLDALQAGGVTGFLWDDELKGFGLKVSAGGSASYVVQFVAYTMSPFSETSIDTRFVN